MEAVAPGGVITREPNEAELTVTPDDGLQGVRLALFGSVVGPCQSVSDVRSVPRFGNPGIDRARRGCGPPSRRYMLW